MTQTTQRQQLDDLVKRMIELSAIDGVKDEVQPVICWYNRQMHAERDAYQNLQIIDYVTSQLDAIEDKYSIGAWYGGV